MLQLNDKSLGITIENANVRIGSVLINPGLPFAVRAKSTFQTLKDPETGEDQIDPETGDPVKVEILGDIIRLEKRYNVTITLDFLNESCEGVYHKEQVSINDLAEKDLSFKSFYTKLTEIEKFKGAKDV